LLQVHLEHADDETSLPWNVKVDHNSAQCDGMENVGITATVSGNSYILSHTSGTYSTCLASLALAISFDTAPITLLAILQDGTKVLTSNELCNAAAAATAATTATTKFELDYLLTKIRFENSYVSHQVTKRTH
jgi:hypothetical protein